MPWNDKYWDIISNLYWTPRFIGLKSISRDKWKVAGDWISIPRELVTSSNGPLYFRARKIDELKTYLHGQEEILNHFFNLVFSIAGDEILSTLFCRPLEIVDHGPFDSIGREVGARYGWRDKENVTQQDGFFVSPSSLIGVELKLDSTSWPEQIAKYKFFPHVIEPSAGADRFVLAVLCEAFTEDSVPDANGKLETRTLMKFHPRLAPIKAAIFPLVNKEGMPEKATELYRSLKPFYNVFYDASGAVGRRYRRQDEVGTPFCITIDGDTMTNGTVTIRDRDTTVQRRIPITDVKAEIDKLIAAA